MDLDLNENNELDLIWKSSASFGAALTLGARGKLPLLLPLLAALDMSSIAYDGLEVKGMVTCNWLQSKVSCLLNHNMDYCCVKKYGSVQYHHSGDLSSRNHPSDCRDEVAVVVNIDFQQKKYWSAVLFLTTKSIVFVLTKW